MTISGDAKVGADEENSPIFYRERGMVLLKEHLICLNR
ncbi:hypothetical protein Ct9H90mP29_16010 [bacterium]|nr:MAG: hypothetical protein Ct9H90mP29_16010 [bacterium]